MKYIPGFSNYLQAAVPRYARGGRIQYGEPMVYDGAQEDIFYDNGYSEPVYQQPVYQEPVYQQPVYQEPVSYDPYQYVNPYEAPVYQEAAYQQPVYQEPAYTAPVYQEPVYIPQYPVEDYGIIGGLADQYTAPRISEAQVEADRFAVIQAEAAQAEAQRIASERAIAERYAADQAAAQAEAQRIAAAQIEAERYAAARAEAQRVADVQAAEQARVQAAEQTRVQAAEQARVQAEAQAAEQARAQAAEQARAQAAEQTRVQAAEQARAQAEVQAAEQQVRTQAAQQAEAVTQAEAQPVATQQAAPVYQEPAYTPPVDYTAALENLQSQYAAPPAYQEPAYQEPVYTPAFEPVTQEPVYNGPAAEQPYVEPYQYQQPVYNEPAYTPAAEQPYVEPYAAPYTAAAEQPYVAPAETPYIPGFSNYLETSVAPYVAPAEVAAPAEAAAPYVEPYQPTPTAQPMTQEAAPFDPSTLDLSALQGIDLSGLDSLYGMNMASNFGGGPMGGIYPDNPNLQYIGAPVSNKGNPTSPSGNVFTMTPDQPVRLVDLNTNQVIFEGTGYDAARKATELGQNLSDTLGRKASYDIQTADPSGAYTTVANEKKNKSTLGTIADIAGTALPIAVSLIPGLQFLGPVASAALAGGAGAALKGDNILKGVAMGGLSAAGGQVLGPALGAGGALGTDLAPKLATAIGTGLGSTAGGLATGQSLKSSLLGGVASGALSYVAPDIQRELGISPKSGSIFRGGDTSASTGGGTDSGAVYGGPNAEIVVNAPAFSTPNINLGGFKTPAQNFVDKAPDITGPTTETPYASDIINVTGSVPGAVTGGLNLGALTPSPQQPTTEGIAPEDLITVTGQRPGAVTGGLPVTTPPAVLPTTEGIAPEDLITVTGQRPGAVTGGLDVGALTTTAPAVLPNDIVVDATRVEQPTGGLTLSQNDLDVFKRVSDMENAPAPKDIVVTGNKIEPAYVNLDTNLGTGSVTDTLPVPKLDTTIDDGKKLGLEEYLRIAGLVSGLIGGGGSQGQAGTYTRGGGSLNPIFSAKLPTSSGFGVAGMNRTARPMGNVDWLTYGERPELSFYDYAARANPAPITSPIPGNPAGPSMYFPDRTRFAKGGRTEFAVNGPGTGRSDDIPAVLSDGEYVIDAETVALLGDGSSKAGAKKLDDLRVKVRKHKGQKLAKGRFSANAKKPEAYLSGGRI